MPKRIVVSLGILLLTLILQASASTVVFYEKDFPAVENGTISRTSLERALASLKPRFAGLKELMGDSTLANADLLILPYGSAIPRGAWDRIQPFLVKGNLLVIGGTAVCSPGFTRRKEMAY